MPTLREKMKEEMQLIGLSQATQKHYLKGVIQLHDHYQQSPATLSPEQLRDYLLYLLNEKKLAPATYNTHIYALRFFYCTTLHQPLKKLELRTVKVNYPLPTILSREEVERLIQATNTIQERALLMMLYGAGLRISEALHLKQSDIDSQRMTLPVRHSKGGKDRYVILSPRMYQVLRDYWKVYHFSDCLFPNKRNPQQPLSVTKARHIYQIAKEKAKITKPVSLHGLRHAFATHSLEAGTDAFKLKTLLGHSRLETTLRYLAFIPDRKTKITLPIELLVL